MPKTIEIKGVIVGDDMKFIYDWFGIAATSPGDVKSVLADAGADDIEVLINSGGGSVYAGSEIYTALKEHQGNVTVKVVGIAASAASVIAMGGDHVAIAPTAQMMIHNVSSYAEGDYRDLAHESDVLKNFNTSIANAYRLRTGLDEAELLDMMNKETWLNAQQAVEKKFADEVMFDSGRQLSASFGSGLLPPEVISKARSMILKDRERQNQTAQNVKEQRLYAAKLSLLKLKGVDCVE